MNRAKYSKTGFMSCSALLECLQDAPARPNEQEYADRSFAMMQCQSQ